MDFTEIINNIKTAVESTNPTEWIVFVTSIAYVVLAAKENSWCWIFGIIASILSIYLCYLGNLFLESGLQFIYTLFAFYGWFKWKRNNKTNFILSVSKVMPKTNFMYLAIGVVCWLPLAHFTSNYSTQAMPYLDAFITAFSLIATYLTAKKIIENWLYWIVVDLLAIVLYANRNFYLISILYFVYTIIAIKGYLNWKKQLIK